MNPFVAHLFSGQILFTGLALMIGLLFAHDGVTHPQLRRLTMALIWITGLVTISTAAVHGEAIYLLLASLGIWSGRAWLADYKVPRGVSFAIPIIVSLTLMAFDLPWTLRPTIPLCRERSVVVLGDSLSAGLGEGEGTPWPFQLRDTYKVRVHNLSEAGATTHDALRQIRTTDYFPGLVVVELGGNDLLGGRSCAEFEHDLDGILAYLHEHQRTVVMLELPLLPGKNQWGVVQRRLARRYGCHLAPKRLLVDVLSAQGSTVDTLHLTQAGHHRLSEMIWSVIGPAFPAQ